MTSAIALQSKVVTQKLRVLHAHPLGDQSVATTTYNQLPNAIKFNAMQSTADFLSYHRVFPKVRLSRKLFDSFEKETLVPCKWVCDNTLDFILMNSKVLQRSHQLLWKVPFWNHNPLKPGMKSTE